MALDGITLHFLKEEIGSALIGSRIEKLHQPSREELVLVFRSRNGVRRLLLSARAQSPKIHFTEYPPENPDKPPMFCMLLRKHLTSALLTNVRQEGLERALFLDFDATNEIGSRVKLTLAVEIMAQYSNIILINCEGTILDSIKRVDSEKSSLRQILPGMLYRLPPKQNKPDLTEVSAADVVRNMAQFFEKSSSSALLSSVQGISPIVSREVVFRALNEDKRVSLLTDADEAALVAEIDKLKDFTNKKEAFPCSVADAGGKPLDFSFLPITQCEILRQLFRAARFVLLRARPAGAHQAEFRRAAKTRGESHSAHGEKARPAAR